MTQQQYEKHLSDVVDVLNRWAMKTSQGFNSSLTKILGPRWWNTIRLRAMRNVIFVNKGKLEIGNRWVLSDKLAGMTVDDVTKMVIEEERKLHRIVSRHDSYYYDLPDFVKSETPEVKKTKEEEPKCSCDCQYVPEKTKKDELIEIYTKLEFNLDKLRQIIEKMS